MVQTYVEKKENWMGREYNKFVMDFEQLFHDWFSTIPKDDQIEFLKSVSLETSVASILFKRLAEDDPDFWCSDDYERTLPEMLSMCEDTLISKLKWNLLELTDIKTAVRHIHSDKELYWKMYHDPKHGEFFTKWLRANTPHNTWEIAKEAADKKLDELKQLLEQKLDALKGE